MIYQQQSYVAQQFSFPNSDYHHSNTESLDNLVFHYSSSSSTPSVEVINLDHDLEKQVVLNVYQYMQNKYGSDNCHHQSSQREYHVVDNFLNIYRPQTPFIGKAEAIKEYIQQTFTATTGISLPEDISIRICTADELKRVHGNFSNVWSDGIQGFSLNKTREIFVKEGELDRVMLVIGHEIGHVLSNTLDDKHDEEAKAFAFECAWMEAIVKHNIANLKDSINLEFIPANNGLHDIAFGFVRNVIKSGKEALMLFRELIKGEMKVNSL